MADTETKKLVYSTNAVGLNGSSSLQLVVPDGFKMNLHNVWWGMSIEPENADANAQGTWVLYLESDSTVGIFVPSITNLNLENINFKIIACGTWMGSNQTPYNMSEHLGTSRNIRQNGRMVFVMRVNGITAGNARVVMSLCAGSNTF